jgi:hypothetical protein
MSGRKGLLDHMRIFIAPIFATLAFGAASPATAQSKPVSDPGTSIQISTIRDAAAERESYIQRARDEVRVWQQKLYDFDTKVQVKGTAARASASSDLDDAWAATRTASERLETVAEADWDSAKASFKNASHKLDVAWRKLTPSKIKPSH